MATNSSILAWKIPRTKEPQGLRFMGSQRFRHEFLNHFCCCCSVVQSRLALVTLWAVTRQASLSFTTSQTLLKLTSLESVLPSSHLILCRPLLLMPSFCSASGSFLVSQFFTWGSQSMGVSASASVLPMNIQDWFPLGQTDWISLQSKGPSRVFSDYSYKHL